MSELVLPDARLHYAVHGDDGPWMFLISGLGGHGCFWASQVQAFSRHYRVVTHDHRGHGRSTGGDASAGIEQCATDAARLMEHLDVDRTIVLGHSMGGMIAQQLALDTPARIASIVISASSARLSEFSRLANGFRRRVLQALGPADFCRLQTLLTAGALADQPLQSLLKAEEQSLAGLADSVTLNARLQSLARFDRSAELGRILVPALVISAEDDGHAPPADGRALAQALPHGRFVPIPAGGGHFFPRTRADDFNAVVLDFLSSQPSSPSGAN